MRVQYINNNLTAGRQTFRGVTSTPGNYALRSQILSAEDADRFVSAMKAAGRQDATSSNFMSAFANKLVLAGEILGFGTLKHAGEVMKTPEHKELVKVVDKGVSDMLRATGYDSGKPLNIAA